MNRTSRTTMIPGRRAPTGAARPAWAARATATVAAVLVVTAAACAGGPPAAESAPAAGSDSADPAQVILITGSTSGLGAELARRLAGRGAHVIVHGRDRDRGEAVVAEIAEAGMGSAAFYAADLADLDAVRELAGAIRRDYDRLDVLVNNAGIWLPGQERRVSQDGHELHFAVNYLAGFLLTHELLPLMEGSAPSRIINVASAAQQPIDFDDVMLEDGYTGGRAYAQSKLAQILFTVDLAEGLADRRVTVAALHPATLMDTPMVQDAGVRPRATVEEGVEAVMNIIMAPELESGQYFDRLTPTRAHEQAYDEHARERLRRLSQRLTGAGAS
jgi:NAD(P)-dependent dehydrogenase (short-subunit alcohol dehydrogenase family)